MSRVTTTLIACVIASVGLGGCDLLNPSRLLIENVGTSVAENVVVSTSAGQQWTLGDLPSGETLRFSESIPGEGGVEVSYTTAGKRVRSIDCYYTSGGLGPARGTVTIKEGQVHMRCGSG